MDCSQFLHIREELSPVAVLLLLFLVDLFMSPDVHRQKGTRPVLNIVLPATLMVIHTVINLVPSIAADIFDGAYHYAPMYTAVKSILNIGTLIVFLVVHEWIKRDDTSLKQGEFYVPALSTLFGMYLMVSAGHLLALFIGLEVASIPMAALITLDKYRHNSAEAGAKYIFTALFSSALSLFGLSMIYGSAGTLCFDDLSTHIDGNPLQIMALVFFFTDMTFKLSLVPLHLWTADVYESVLSTVTAYLSVISKGSAAFVLMATPTRVFASVIHDRQEVLYWVTTASITIADISVIRQQNLKHLMASSNISQTGYIMPGVIGGTAQGMIAMVYYISVYAAASLGVFAVITIVTLRSQEFTLEDYTGFYETDPKMAFLMTISLFSLAGVPPSAGFFSKPFIFMVAFEADFHLLVFITPVNTVVLLYHYLLIVKAMYIAPSDNPIPTFRNDRCTKQGLALCIPGIIRLGIASIVYQSIDKLSFGI